MSCSNKYHWVEDEREVVVFVGSKAEALSWYKKHGGAANGLHLISSTSYAHLSIGEEGTKVYLPSPVVGEKWS